MWPFRPTANPSLRQRLQRANRALQRRDLAAAITAYESVLAEAPENLSALLNLGTALHLNSQHTPAIQRFERVLELDPQNATAWLNLAVAHGALGHLDKGVAALLQALELAPAKRDLHYNLAALYLRKGEVVRAMAEFEMELALHPDHKLARAAAEELRRQHLGEAH